MISQVKKEKIYQRIIYFLYGYLLFFINVAFVVSCSMILFLSVMTEVIHLELTAENMNMAAKLTFVNVMFLSAVFLMIDTLRRKLTIEKITKRIASAAGKLVSGDFSVRITQPKSIVMDKNLREIIKCFN